MPIRLSALSALVGVSLLAACGDDDRPPPTDGGMPPTDGSTLDGTISDGPAVSGRCDYEHLEPTPAGLPTTGTLAPCRGATVEVVLADGTLVGDGLVADDGAFRIPVPEAMAAETLTVRVLAQQVASDHAFYVANLAENVFSIEAEVPAGLGPVELVAGAAAGEGRPAAAFHLLEHALRMVAFWRGVTGDPGLAFPPLVMFYEVGNDEGTYFWSGDTAAFGEIDQLWFLGLVDDEDDAFDDSVIQHELGHYLEWEHGSWLSPSGGHSGDLYLDPGLALSEALSTFLGQLVLGTPSYLDASADGALVYDMETGLDPPTVSVGTMYGEDAVTSLLWDLVDDPAGDDDPFAIDAETIWAVFTEDVRDGELKSLHTWLDALVARGAVDDAALNAAFGGAPFEVPRPAADPSPPFPDATFTATGSTSGTLDGTQGEATTETWTRGATAWYGIELASRGAVSLAVTMASPGADVDLYLESTERDILEVAATLDTTERIDTTLEAGRYLVTVTAYDGPATTNYTLDVTLP